MSTVSQMVNEFRRSEFKYLISDDLADQLKDDLRVLQMSDDMFVVESSKKYKVWSLYLDTPSLTCYWQKLNGDSERKKFRLRWYEEGRPVFFIEKKFKLDNAMWKQRAMLPGSDFYLFLERPDLYVDYESEIVKSFVSVMLQFNLSPTLLVSYEREPLVSSWEKDFRITLDSCVETTMTDGVHPTSTSELLFSNHVILEVKFRQRYPFWFGNLVKKYNLERVSISKYCYGLAKCANVYRSL